jgi:O-antigen/teichoic acid export membrane protein
MLAGLVTMVRRHIGHLAASLAGVVVVQAIGVVTGILLARGLGPQDRGVLAAMILWPAVVVTVGELGLASSFTYYTAQRHHAAGRLLRTSRKMALLQSLCLVPIGMLMSFVGLSYAGISPRSAGLFIAAVLIPVALVSRYAAAILQGMLKIRAFYALRLSMYGVHAIGYALLFYFGQLTVWTAILVYAAGAVVQLVVSVVLPARLLRDTSAVDAEEVPARALLGYGLRSHFGSLYPLDALWVDQMLISFFLGARDLGLYVAALAFATLPRMVAWAVGLSGTPIAARAPAAARTVTVWRFLALGFLALVPLTGLLMLMVPYVLPWLFGESFADAVIPTQLLLLASVPFGLRVILGDCLRGIGLGGMVSIVEVVSWPFVLAAVALGARAGLSGVALALLVIQVACLVLLVVIWRWTRAPHEQARGAEQIREAGRL